MNEMISEIDRKAETPMPNRRAFMKSIRVPSFISLNLRSGDDGDRLQLPARGDRHHGDARDGHGGEHEWRCQTHGDGKGTHRTRQTREQDCDISAVTLLSMMVE